MFRRTPVFHRLNLLSMCLGLTAVALLAHACAEPDSRPAAPEVTGPQLAGGPSASCEAPCVEVEVSVKGRGPSQPADGIVVTLWRGGQPGDGEAFHELADIDGIATFDLTGEVGPDPDGFCTVARPLTSTDDAETLVDIDPDSPDQLNVFPNADGVAAPSAPWQGSVSESQNKSQVLNKPNLVSNCISWATADDAPFSVDETTSLRVRMEMNEAAASIDITCLFPDNTGANCESWTIIPLDDVTIPWEGVLPDGVRKGFLASVGLGSSPAVNDGLAFGETYAVEVAQGEFSASKVITTPEQSGNQSASIARTAELETILCVVNDGSPDFFESEGEVTTGMDIQSPVLDGYAGINALGFVLFKPDPAKVVISFDYLDLGGDLTANLQMRARENPAHPDNLSTNINKKAKYDFASCPGSPTLLSENTEDLISFSIVCRDDPLAPNRKHVEITATVPEKRLIEWDINTPEGEKHPEVAKNNASSALRLIDQPEDGFDAVCPLQDSGFGSSNDPKYWGGAS
ncbi:MAG: hypothetical protein GWN32_01045 [Gemmatimonadetes bacterium]|nr:hypothetical protein [Gemmatimonadota bacterium]